MADRGNIKIVYSEGSPVYFYTHSRGSEIEKVVKTALQRRQRWDDDGYLARIIFNTLTQGQEGAEIGFGISPFQIEEGSPLITVNTVKRSVTFKDKTKCFEDFIK